jgi:hypothetical protein
LRSRAPLLLLGLCAAGAVALVLAAGADERRLAFALNVRPERPVAVAAPGQEACQRGIESSAPFQSVGLLLGTYARPGPPLDVTARRTGARTVLASGRLPAGAADNRGASVRLDREVPEGGFVDVCARNAGERRVAFYGGPTIESPGHAFVDGRPATGDMQIVFHRGEPATALSLVPDMFERAALFRPPGVGAWTFWVLLAGVAVAVPLLLAWALRAALSDEAGRSG